MMLLDKVLVCGGESFPPSHERVDEGLTLTFDFWIRIRLTGQRSARAATKLLILKLSFCF